MNSLPWPNLHAFLIAAMAATAIGGQWRAPGGRCAVLGRRQVHSPAPDFGIQGTPQVGASIRRV